MKLLQVFKQHKVNRKEFEVKPEAFFISREENQAGEDVPADDVSGKTSTSVRTFEYKEGHNVAEFICFYVREGATLEELSEVTDYSVKDITAIVEEAKQENLFDFLADKFVE